MPAAAYSHGTLRWLADACITAHIHRCGQPLASFHKEVSGQNTQDQKPTFTMACAASLPDRMAPSIDARYFCFVKSPARYSRGMGLFCSGRAACARRKQARQGFGIYHTTATQLCAVPRAAATCCHAGAP